MQADFRNILLLKPSSLGDIVHALPTAAALRRRFPSAALTWLVKRQWAAVLEANPSIDRVLPVDLTLAGWPEAVRAVRAGQFDLVVDLQGLLRSAILGWLSHAPTRIGFASGREGSPWFYTQKVGVPDPTIHAVDRYLLIARALGAPPQESEQLQFPLAMDTAADKRLQQLVNSAGVSPGIPLVAINAGARWPTKQWSPASFAQVADQLQKEGIRVAVSGAPAETDAGRAVVRHMTTSPIDLVGKTNIKELIALLRRSCLLITNDSGPMHLAAALSTPVIALFGPTDPRRTGPYGAGHVILRSGIPCSPCLSRRCVNPNALECLTSISSEQVFHQALRMVRDSNQASTKQWQKGAVLASGSEG
ncbi:MAG TPA: lipopolysaccharide heptosyltransferase II [Nitrospirales bacterium]|jgi:lipopolysaccharide heptosyltransferase I